MSTRQPSSDVVLRSVRLVPVAGRTTPTDLRDRPVDVLLRDGRVAEVGPDLAAPGVEEVRADGRFLAPGL